MNQPELGKKIAELRKARGYTQEELVEKCNLSVRTLQRIESGEVTPRSYTLKTIFTALDYTVYDSSESADNGFSNTESVVSNRLGQFYKYVIDLFNLKTNTMKKISILSIVFSAIIIGLFALITESKAQKENKTPVEGTNVSKKLANHSFSNFSCDECLTEDDVMTGRDVKFIISGVTVNVRLIKLNTMTLEFNALFAKGRLLENKVEVTISKDLFIDHRCNYTADKEIEVTEDKIILKGNAKLTSSRNETIEAEEILITKN